MFHFFRRLQMKSFRVFLLIFFLPGPRLSAKQTSESISFHQQISNYCHTKNEMSCLNQVEENKRGLASIDTILSCKNYFKRNNCEDVKNSLQASNRGLVISCEPNEICKDSGNVDILQCSFEGMVSQIKFTNLAMTLGGAASTSVYGMAGVPVSIFALSIVLYQVGQEAKECDSNLRYKKLAVKMHNLTLFENERPLDVETKDKALLKMPCSDLNSLLSSRLEVFAEKRNQEKLWNPKAHEYRQSPAALAMLKSLRSNRCFNAATIAKETCRSLAGLLTDIVLGAVTQTLTNSVVSHLKPSMMDDVPIANESTSSASTSKFTNWFRGHVESVWSPNTPQNIKKAVQAFRQRKKLPNGTTYGKSVREIEDIEGMSPIDLDKNLVSHGFEKHHSVIHDPVTHAPVLDVAGHEIPMDVYTHPDGGMVRVKPLGDPTQKFRTQPLASKAVRSPANAPYDDFNFEAFKVDKNGLPLPKWAPDINNPFAKDTPEAREFLDGWASSVHFDLAH